MTHFKSLGDMNVSVFFKMVCYACLFHFIQFSFSQEIKQTLAWDSLATKSYKELNSLFAQANANSNNKLLHIYREYHLKKAKLENNTLEMARAYYNFIGWEDFENDLAYCDSIIDITQNSTHRAYPTNGYLIKATLYYNNSEFSNALDNYIIASEFAEQKGYKPLQIEATQGIAAIKNVWGLHDEALQIYKTNYNDIINTPNYTETLYEDYMILASNLSLSYIRNNKADSALAITVKGMKAAQTANDTINYYDLAKIHATANYYANHYPQALDSLLKFSSKFSGFTLADSYYMIGKLYQYQNKNDLKINYFKKIDSIHRIINDPFPELKEVYNELFKHASAMDDKKMQLYYIDQLINVDSILDFNYTNIGDKVRLDYDIPKLKKEKQVLKQELDSKRQILIVTLCAILLLCAFAIHYYREHRKLNKRFKHFKVETAKMVDFKVSKTKTHPLKISDAIVSNILQKLEVFEKEKLFMDCDIKLHSLAKICNTNATYLSQVINLYKEMNVSTYLKNLRITNAIETIKKDRKYLKYSIEGLAKEFGFITAESFSKAFEEKTGHKTSKFLNSLRQNVTNNP